MLVTPAELATYTDQTFSNRQEDAASMVLLGLQGELEAWLRRPVEPITVVGEMYVLPDSYGAGSESPWYSTQLNGGADDFAPVNPVAPHSIPFVYTPVISVTSVMVDGVAASVGVDYVNRGWGIDLYTGFRNATVLLSYQAGHSASALPINFFRLLILRAASREMQNLFDDVVGIKDLQAEVVVPATTGFTEAELFSCRKWRRKQLT